MRFLQPFKSFRPQLFGYVQPTQFSSLGIQVEVAQLHMLDFDLDELADASAGGSQIPNHEVPLHVTILLEMLFQKVVVGIADYIFEEVLLLYLHSFEPQTILVQEFQILVHRLDAQVDGLRLEELHQITFVGQQVFLVDLIVVGMIKVHCPEIGMDGVLRKIALSQVLLKCFSCPHKKAPPNNIFAKLSRQYYRGNM